MKILSTKYLLRARRENKVLEQLAVNSLWTVATGSSILNKSKILNHKSKTHLEHLDLGFRYCLEIIPIGLCPNRGSSIGFSQSGDIRI